MQACEPAAKLALEDVNAKKDLLPGYTLRLHWNDSGVSLFGISVCLLGETKPPRYRGPKYPGGYFSTLRIRSEN